MTTCLFVRQYRRMEVWATESTMILLSPFRRGKSCYSLCASSTLLFKSVANSVPSAGTFPTVSTNPTFESPSASYRCLSTNTSQSRLMRWRTWRGNATTEVGWRTIGTDAASWTFSPISTRPTWWRMRSMRSPAAGCTMHLPKESTRCTSNLSRSVRL